MVNALAVALVKRPTTDISDLTSASAKPSWTETGTLRG
jgi:hypothetical protein